MTISKPLSRQPLPENAQKVFEGVVFDVYQWEQEQFDGSHKTFEKLKRKDTVLVLGITAEKELIFIEEEQPGKQSWLSFVGGGMEEGEDPLSAAKRELLEETGFAAEEYVLVDAVQPISKVEWAIYTYVARNCKKVAEQKLDAGEKIALKFFSFDEAIAIIASDDFADKEGYLPRAALRAHYDPKKRQELKELLFGK